MANEGTDDYQPDPVKIDAFEKLKKSIDEAKKRDAKRNKNKHEQHSNGNEKSKEPEAKDAKADCSIFITFEQWQAKLLEKYNKLYDTVAQNMPHLWASLEFGLSIKNILHVKDIGQPFAGIVLGKPSSLKTVGLEMFRKSKDTHYTDHFTARSFVPHNSGLTEERLQQIDLLPKIRNKCFLTPELAPIFAAKDEDLLSLLGIMTRVLDGYGYENDSGAQGHRGYNERMMFTWIGAAVDIPFKVHKLMTTLGPRLYFLRIPSTQNKSEEDYLSQLEHSDFDVRRDRIQVALMDYLNWLECACPMMEHDDKFNSELKKMPWLNGQATANDYNKIQTQRKALRQIIKLAKLLAPLRGVVPTWHTYNTQGSDYGYTLPTIEEPDRAMQQLVNLARGHAMLTGRNYITSEEDLPMIVKVVLSTAPIERVTIFDILLANNGVLNVNQITQSLRVSEHTAQRTMLELDILGLVDKADDVWMVCSDGVTRNGSQITLKEEFQWFLSEEFTSLRQGFKPTKGEEQEAREEKSPPHTEPILDRIEESNANISTEQSTSQYEKKSPQVNMIQRAAQLIALNKTAFNGLFRVNSKGEFNTPWGQYENPTICDSTNLRNISNILRNPKVTIGVCDYKQMLLENAKAGDFVYLDPPYHPESQTADFTAYTPDKFTENDQKRLAEVFKQLHEINCKVMLTNSNTPLIRDLYCDFAKFTVQAESRRSINCKGSKRKTEGHTDRIIRNYNNCI